MNTLEFQIDSVPANPDVERSILGAVLLESKAYDEAAAHGLTSADFYLDSHRRIYAAMQSVVESGRPIDTVTLSAELDSRRDLERVGGYAYIADLITGVPERPSIMSYIPNREGESSSTKGRPRLHRHHHFNRGWVFISGRHRRTG